MQLHKNVFVTMMDEGVESSGAKKHIILQGRTKMVKYRVAEPVYEHFHKSLNFVQ